MLKGLFFSIFLFGFSAHAGLMIEPYLGYQMGQVKSKAVGSSTEYTDNSSGATLGARLGYKFLLPWVALDYSTWNGTAKVDPALSGGRNYDFNRTAMAIVVGADLPIGLRVYGGYGFSDSTIVKSTSSSPDTKFTGTHTKAGLGFSLIPFVSLNAEYIMPTYKKVDDGTTNAELSTIYSSFSHNTVLISLSVPFSL